MTKFANTLTLSLIVALCAAVWVAPLTYAEESAETQPVETQPEDAGAAEEADDQGPNMAALLDPTHESWSRQAPETFKVKFTTTQGDVVIQVTRAWAPLGADRFYNLVDNGFYDGVKFFRVIEGFMAQFGINGNPEVSDVWREQPINDDPNTQPNSRGRVTFAMAGPDTRTSQLFISFGDNSFLDDQGFSPFGEVIEGMEVIDALHPGYGESPDQGRIQHEGNPYLEAEFPRLDSLNTARVVE